jgi:DNA-binding protein HU-beta
LISGNFPNDTQEVAVNRSELIDSVANSTGLDKRQAEGAVTAFVNSVIGETTSGNKVSIFGFGTFTPKSRAARTGRNPRTGTPVKIAASNAVGFAPAAAYKSALNARAGGRKAGAKKAAPAAKSSAKKATAKASAAKKAPAKKATAKKAPAKKTAARATKTAKKR